MTDIARTFVDVEEDIRSRFCGKDGVIEVKEDSSHPDNPVLIVKYSRSGEHLRFSKRQEIERAASGFNVRFEPAD